MALCSGHRVRDGGAVLRRPRCVVHRSAPVTGRGGIL